MTDDSDRVLASLEHRVDLLRRVDAIAWPDAADLVSMRRALDERAALLAKLAEIEMPPNEHLAETPVPSRARAAALIDEANRIGRRVRLRDAEVRRALLARRDSLLDALDRAGLGGKAPEPAAAISAIRTPRSARTNGAR